MNYHNGSHTILFLLLIFLINGCGDEAADQNNTNKTVSPPATAQKQTLARDYTKDKELYDKTTRAQILLDEYFGNHDNLTEATRLVNEVLKSDEEYVPAYIQMARSLLKDLCTRDCKDYDPVENILVKAMKLDPDYADTYVLMGNLYNHKNDFIAATLYLDRAKKMGTKNPWLYYNYADIYYLQRDYAAADKLYEEVVKLGPGNTSQQLNAYINSLQKQQEIAYQNSQSERLLNLAKKTVAAAHPKDAWTRGNTGNYLCREGYFDEGIGYSKDALSIMQYGNAYGYIAFCSYGKWAELITEGKTEEAQKYFDEAFRLDPDIEKIAIDFSGSGQKLRELRPILVKKIDEIAASKDKPQP